MAEVIAGRKVRMRVAARVRSGVCLCCDRQASRRGLCQSCYRYFLIGLRSKPSAEQPAWEEVQIRQGKILAVGQRADIMAANPFSDSPWRQSVTDREGGAA